MVAEELRGGDGVVVRIEGDGTLRVGWGEVDWFGPARLSLAGAGAMPARSTTRRDGADDLGTPGAPRSTIGWSRCRAEW